MRSYRRKVGGNDAPLSGLWVAQRTEYDRLGRVTFSIADDESVTWRTYDGLGRVLTATDALGNTTRNWYDDAGNVIETSRTLVGTIDDRQSNALTTDTLTTFFYDSLGRLVTQVDNAGRATDMAYDSLGGRTLRRAMRNGVDLDLRRDTGGVYYDPMGNPTAYLHRNTNQSGDPTVVGFKHGGHDSEAQRTQFARTRRVARQPHAGNKTGHGGHDPEAQRTQFARTRRVPRQQHAGNKTGHGGHDPEAQRTQFARTRRVPRQPHAGNKTGHGGHDPEAQRTQFARTRRVARQPHAGNKTGHGGHDPEAQRTQFARTRRVARQPHAGNKTGHGGHDSEAQRTQFARTRRVARQPHAGNKTGHGGHDSEAQRTQFARTRRVPRQHDAFNRLVEVRDATTNALIARYAYDTGNRRMRKDVTAAATAGQDTDFAYAGWQLLEETAHDATGTPRYAFVWGNYIDEVLCRDEADGDRLFYHQNTLMSVSAVTDETGAVVERYAYDPYGKVTVFSPTGTVRSASYYDVHHLYTGRERDAETGLQLNRNRYYDPETGRWINRDPIGFKGGLNLYEYVGGRGVKFADPQGKAAKEWIILTGSLGVSASGGITTIEYKDMYVYLVRPKRPFTRRYKCSFKAYAYGLTAGINLDAAVRTGSISGPPCAPDNPSDAYSGSYASIGVFKLVQIGVLNVDSYSYRGLSMTASDGGFSGIGLPVDYLIVHGDLSCKDTGEIIWGGM